MSIHKDEWAHRWTDIQTKHKHWNQVIYQELVDISGLTSKFHKYKIATIEEDFEPFLVLLKK
jgi:hypothetical protein